MTTNILTIKQEITVLSGDSKWNFIKTKAYIVEFDQYMKTIKLERVDRFFVESKETTIDQVVVWLKSKFDGDGIPIYSQDYNLKLQPCEQDEISNLSRLIFFKKNTG